jgi:hypothetical protein
MSRDDQATVPRDCGRRLENGRQDGLSERVRVPPTGGQGGDDQLRGRVLQGDAVELLPQDLELQGREGDPCRSARVLKGTVQRDFNYVF